MSLTNNLHTTTGIDYEEISTKFTFTNSRREKMGGRDYVVAPASMLVPGVLNGSQGPLYYPKEEVLKNVEAWNMMPLTLGHTKNEKGEYVSARNPKILEKFGLGFVFNASGKKGKLDGEAWFDVDRTNALAPGVIDKVLSNQQIELSTGLYTEQVPARNKKHKGRTYDAVVKNLRPDHLAVLLNEKGACSIYDGCGINNRLIDNKKLPKGRKLNKPFRTPSGPKKFAVYTKNDKGNVVLVRFGDPNMEIKRDDPARRKSFRARHNCSSPGPKWKARYWSCKMWSSTPVSKIANEGDCRYSTN